MPSTAETTIRSRMWKPVALLALAVMACAGLAGCGGGGSGGGEEVTIVPQPSPDLVVESPSVSDANPIAGANFTLSATVRNAGSAAAPAATLRFYRSDDATIEPFDEEVGDAPVAELSASESEVASVESAAPSTPGVYYYGACADAVEGESEAANNCSASVQVTVPGSRPDLVVESPSVSDANPLAGANFTLSAAVRNAGSAAASATALRFYRSDDAAITPSDAQVDAASVGELAASGSRVASVELEAPSTSGIYYYGACVDAVAGESEAANNCSASVRVTVPEAQTPAFESLIPAPVSPRPDLVLGSPWTSPASPAAGGTFALWVNVRNAGGGHAGRMRVRFYRSEDATITTSDTQLSVIPRRKLLAGESYQENSGRQDTPDLGAYYYGVCVDAVVGESDTTNNCSAALRVEVTHDKPNLQIRAFGSGPPRDGDGSLFSMDATVRNIGGPSAATTLRFYQSTDKEFTSLDIEIASVSVPALEKTVPREFARFLSRRVNVPAPSAPGTYYYGACVDAVADESDTTDNCSSVIHSIRR